MSNYDDAPEETEDRFYAQFDSRDVKLMTLDELQAAFEAGEIHENTFVCREGESEWLTLAVVAGMGEEAEEEQAPPEPAVAERRPPMPNRAPAGAVETRPPMPNRAPAGVETRPPMPNRAPAGVETRPPMPQRGPDTENRRPPMPNRRPEMNTMPASRQVSAYPPVAVAPAYAAPVSPLSYAPVTSSVGLDLDELSLRPKRRLGRVFGALAAVAVIGGGAAFVATGGLHMFALPSMSALESASGKSQASLTLSNIEAKPSSPAPLVAKADPAPEPAPAPAPAAAPSAAGDSPSSAGATAGFSDDMKSALLAADNQRKTKHASKVKGRAPSAAAHRGHAAGGTSGFKSGGSAYDPLNGKL